MATVLPQVGFDFCDFLNYDKSLDFELDEIGTYVCPPNYSFGPIIRSRDIFHYVLSGEGKLILEGQEYHIHEKQGFLIPAGKMAYYEADRDNPWSYCWFHIGGNRVPEIFNRIGLNIHQPIFISVNNDNQFEILFDELKNIRSNELLCTAKLYEIVNYLVENSATKMVTEIDNQLEYVRKIINYIQIKYSEPIQVTEIARVCGLNRSYMTRLFKDATGESVQNYIIRYRISRAKILLESTQESVQHIAFLVGYSDIFIFSKSFKKLTGYSPNQWRNHEHTKGTVK